MKCILGNGDQNAVEILPQRHIILFIVAHNGNVIAVVQLRCIRNERKVFTICRSALSLICPARLRISGGFGLWIGNRFGGPDRFGLFGRVFLRRRCGQQHEEHQNAQ